MAAERPRKLMTPISCQSPVSPSRQLVSAKLSSPLYRPSTRLVIARSLGFFIVYVAGWHGSYGDTRTGVRVVVISVVISRITGDRAGMLRHPAGNGLWFRPSRSRLWVSR